MSEKGHPKPSGIIKEYSKPLEEARKVNLAIEENLTLSRKVIGDIHYINTLIQKERSRHSTNQNVLELYETQLYILGKQKETLDHIQEHLVEQLRKLALEDRDLTVMALSHTEDEPN